MFATIIHKYEVGIVEPLKVLLVDEPILQVKTWEKKSVNFQFSKQLYNRNV